MIDFRYHLVSLIAVFLAVALGIVVGTTQLNGPILNDVRNQVKSLEQDKRSLEGQAQQLRGSLGNQEDFVQAVGPALVDGTLTGRGVVIVTADDNVPSDTVDQVRGLVGKAGGSVTGVVQLKPKYTDPQAAASLQSYVTGPGLPAGIELPQTDDAGKLVAALLAHVLMVPSAAGATEPQASSVSSVLAGLTSLGVLAPVTSSVSPAHYAIVLTSGGFTGQSADQRNAALVDLVTALDSVGSGTVVAGDDASAGDSGLVGAVRNSTAASSAVSTVDNVDTAAGRVSTVLALGQERQGVSGKYGTGSDTQPAPPVPGAATQ